MSDEVADEALDPRVAERFQRLDAYRPRPVPLSPDLDIVIGSASPRHGAEIGVPIVLSTGSRPARLRRILAVAGLVIGLVMIALVAKGSDDSPAVVAVGAEGPARESLADVPEDAQAEDGLENPSATATANASSTSNSSESSSTTSPSTTTLTAVIPATSAAVIDPQDSASTAPPGEPNTEAPIGVGAEPSDSPTTSLPDGSEELSLPSTSAPPTGLRHVDGVVTEIKAECEARVLLIDGVAVVEDGPVVCDGGSYVVIDGVRVITATGNIPSGRFNRHPVGLIVGASVAVTAVPSDFDPAVLTLNCSECELVRTS